MSIKTLRRVKDHEDVFKEEDHNDHVDNWNTQVSINEELNPDDPDIVSLINQLKSIVSKMRKVKTGDWYYAQDHNLFVDAWDLQKQINDELKELIDYYESRIAELEAYRPLRFEKAVVLRAEKAISASIYLSRATVFKSEKTISGSISVNVVKE